MVGDGSYDDGADKNDDRSGGVDPFKDDRGIDFFVGGIGALSSISRTAASHCIVVQAMKSKSALE